MTKCPWDDLEPVHVDQMYPCLYRSICKKTGKCPMGYEMGVEMDDAPVVLNR